MSENHAIAIIADNRTGILRDIGTVFAELNANINFIQQDVVKKDSESFAAMNFEVEYVGDISELTDRLKKIPGIREALIHSTAREIFGKRVIVIGGGAQVAQVALGAVNEADRHNIRGERISVDTIPLVGEEPLAKAVDAVSRLPRASILVLAGSIMGGEITDAINRVKESGIPVICLNMAGSASSAADLVVTDPIQAGVMAVMHISSIGVFDLKRVAGKEF
ncbi:MAG TPA: DUF5612 domain-containing protein [Methanocorpusculum sp.]|nr:DUF5612 domain-containing protein [Methanocorpusculum sp.]